MCLMTASHLRSPTTFFSFPISEWIFHDGLVLCSPGNAECFCSRNLDEDSDDNKGSSSESTCSKWTYSFAMWVIASEMLVYILTFERCHTMPCWQFKKNVEAFGNVDDGLKVAESLMFWVWMLGALHCSENEKTSAICLAVPITLIA